jgi:hypothetical protein
MAIIGSNVKVEVQSTLGSPITVSALTKASPGVATATAHGLANGDVVIFSATAGMVELDGQAVRVANITTNTFELESLDTSNYSTWTAGTVKKVSAFATFSAAQSISAPNPQPAKIDITTLVDIVKQYAYGLPDAPDGSIGALFNPGGTVEALILAATRTNGTLTFRVTYSGGQKTIFNAQVSGGQGFDLQQNAAAKTTVSFTPSKLLMHYLT